LVVYQDKKKDTTLIITTTGDSFYTRWDLVSFFKGEGLGVGFVVRIILSFLSLFFLLLPSFLFFSSVLLIPYLYSTYLLSSFTYQILFLSLLSTGIHFSSPLSSHGYFTLLCIRISRLLSSLFIYLFPLNSFCLLFVSLTTFLSPLLTSSHPFSRPLIFFHPLLSPLIRSHPLSSALILSYLLSRPLIESPHTSSHLVTSHPPHFHPLPTLHHSTAEQATAHSGVV
jgi:hypothetical protein